MKLYDTHLAPNPRRVRIFLAEKGIKVETEQVNIVKGENLSADYLAVNPRGVVPALLLDDGTVIDESVAICRYFEALQPEPALMGTDPVSKARIEARQRHMEFDGLAGAAHVFRNSYPGFAQRGLAGNYGESAAIPALVEWGRAMLQRFYAQLDAALATQAFVAGDGFSIADITALCAVDFATGAARLGIPEECQAVRRWHAAVSARPSASA